MTAFMIELTQQVQDGSVQAKQRFDTAVAIHAFCQLLDKSGALPTSAQATQARDTVKVLLQNFCSLHDWAKSSNIMLFHVVPKQLVKVENE